ncbi:MAG: methyltransferase domain-containing protein [Elusimicrobia bacterium]|nr:methyltransferase domain-containing protein [Elusimicrobiota bacterium]
MRTEIPVSADRLIDEIMGYRKAKILMVAAYLDVFTPLESPRTAPALARALSLDARAVEILLDALTAVGYLRKRGRLYSNAPISSRYLVRGRPGYMGDNLKYQEMIWDAWGELRHSIGKGGAVRPLEYWLLRHKGFTQEYIRGMDNIARGPAAEIAAIAAPAPGSRLLDVGAGPGTYSLAFLRANPELRATLLDLPSTLKVTRRMLSEHPLLAARTRLKAGNYRDAVFGREEFDLVLLSHITHDESPEVNRRLIEESFRALKPGGRIIVHDFMLDADRVRPVFGALFSVHMLAYTEGGRTYSAVEYAKWLRRAGFTRLREHRIAVKSRNSSRIIIGVKEK